ncbi:MAG: acyl-CoA dehydrogenase family protein [Terracidiphilus sp.]
MPDSSFFPIVAAAGGSFLLETRTSSEIFTPEDLSEEQRQIAATAAQFDRDEILPRVAAVESKQPGVMQALLRKAGELGFTAVDVPEEYGGLGMDKTCSTLVTDRLSVLASFSTAFGSHAGIATLPLVWYGTEEQKRRYLPKLASGEWIGAYGLSEASSGSDAMHIRTRATLSADGRFYTLDGEKQWLTNGGIASLFTLFAKIVDPVSGSEQFSAFLVERGTPGLTVGAEERKMGIRGSSTCSLLLDGCRVPAGNLLGQPGEGHRIAFNVLNVGRFKLGAACVGSARHVLAEMIRYARQRKAFGKTIAEFGLIQRKISTCATRLFAAESMVYRTIGMIDAGLGQLGLGQKLTPRQAQLRFEEYVVECSILKVYGSEMMSLVADELVATMGGYGFVEPYPAERHYRDARINRIFEGTNEINTLIITGWLMKRAMSGELPLLGAIRKLMDELSGPPRLDAPAAGDELLAREAEVLAAIKKIALFAAGVASQRFLAALRDQQEVMADLAAILIETYALESSLLRARKLALRGGTPACADAARVAANMTGLLADEAMARAEQAARNVLAACSEGDLLRTNLLILRRLARFTPADAVSLSRAVAGQCLQLERYPF